MKSARNIFLLFMIFLALVLPGVIAPDSETIEEEIDSLYVSEVDSINLFQKEDGIVKWEVDGYSEKGFKVVWSKNPEPTYPLSSGDKYHYYSDSSKRMDSLSAFDGSGYYYVRVCEYLGGECGVYSNQIKIYLEDSSVNEETSCSDSDNGLDYFNKGVASGRIYDGTLKENVTDRCTMQGDEEKLLEWFCSDSSGNLALYYYECENGCEDGVCIKESEENYENGCRDTDNGKNYYIKGKMTTSDGKEYVDYCKTENKLVEYFCKNTEKTIKRTCPEDYTKYENKEDCYCKKQEESDEYFQMSVPFTAGGVSVSSEGMVTLKLKNSGGSVLNITKIGIDLENGKCQTTTANREHASGEAEVYEITCSEIPEEEFRGIVSVNYKTLGSDLIQASKGKIKAEIDTEESFIETPFYLNDWQISNSGVQLDIKNKGAENYIIKNIYIDDCGSNSFSESISPAGIKSIEISCTETIDSGDFSEDIKITYTKEGSSLERISEGSVSAYEENSIVSITGNPVLEETDDDYEEEKEFLECKEEYYENNYFVEYECKKGCVNGECLEEYEESLNPIEKEIEIPEDSGKNYVCQGCQLDNLCYPLGYRKDGRYCSENLNFTEQKNENSECENNFECQSNVCVDSQCISGSFIRKVIDWFKNVFS